MRSMLIPLAAVCCLASAAAAEAPKIELTEILSGSKSMIFEGRAVARGGKAAVSYAIKKQGAGEPKFTSVKDEQFSIKVPAELGRPGESLDLLLKASRGGETSSMAATVQLGYDGKLYYFLYFSRSALDLRETKAGPFLLLAPPNVPGGTVSGAAARLTRLTAMADSALALGSYPTFAALLFDPAADNAVAFSQFRGFIDDKLEFAFPVPLSPGGVLKEVDGVLDNWIPHELGDHGVRQFSKKKFDIRWLSEGTGDYLKALWKNGGRAENLKLGRGTPSKPADMLDGDWSPDHYACSARFVKSLTEKHPGILHRLFTEVRSTGGSNGNELTVRETLSRLIEADVTPALRSCGEAP